MGTIGDKPPHPTKKMVTCLYKKRFSWKKWPPTYGDFDPKFPKSQTWSQFWLLVFISEWEAYILQDICKFEWYLSGYYLI